MSARAFSIGMTAIWSLVLLCWCAVYVGTVEPPFGLPRWAFGLIHLLFWATIAGKIWRAEQSSLNREGGK